jgi:hypothetical protein
MVFISFLTIDLLNVTETKKMLINGAKTCGICQKTVEDKWIMKFSRARSE